MSDLLDDLKELWRANHAKHKFNPLLKDVRELIRRHDPTWDDGTELRRPPAPKFDISIMGGKPTST